MPAAPRSTAPSSPAPSSPRWRAPSTRSRPLANRPRIVLFNNVAANWPALAAGDRAEAERLRAWTRREARAALAAEPANWVLHHALARLYRATAASHPGDAGDARRHFERSLELAPLLDPLVAPRAGDGRR